jgi:Flp pilus assembly pilin Flp
MYNRANCRRGLPDPDHSGELSADHPARRALAGAPFSTRALAANRVVEAAGEEAIMASGESSYCGERGQSLVEYVLIILFVAIAVVGGLVLVGPALGSIFSKIVPAL